MASRSLRSFRSWGLHGKSLLDAASLVQSFSVRNAALLISNLRARFGMLGQRDTIESYSDDNPEQNAKA